MHTPLQFAIADEFDIPELVALINRSYRGDAARKGWTHEAALLSGERINTSVLAVEMQQNEALVLKVTDSSKRVAACVYLQAKPDKQMYLGMLTVDPDWQNRGIGKQLLLEAEKIAKAKCCVSISMTVLTARTELINWYQRKGYENTGIESPFPSDAAAGIPLKPLAFVTLQKTI